MIVSSSYAATGEVQPAAGEMHAQTEVSHSDSLEPGFPPFDSSSYPSQIFWLAITFGLFYLFLKRTVLPRISDILENRRDHIAQDLDQASRMKSEADEAIAAYEQELSDARSRATTIAQEARESAKADAQRERSTVEAELSKKLAKAEDHIASIKTTAMQDVGEIAEETATSIIKQLIGRAVPKGEIASAVKAAGN